MIEYEISTDDYRVTIEVVDRYAQQYTRSYFSHHLTDLSKETAEAYLKSLAKHITHVREAGEKIGVDKGQLIAHDASKFSHEEFPHYAEKFHGDDLNPGIERINDNFANAWLHHIHHNPHHWQYWIFPDGYTPKVSNVENGIVYMPPRYALEMIADWMGASMAYTGSWDMMDWLYKNMPRIKLHSTTAAYVRDFLDMQGYADVVYMQKFGHEEA